MGDDYPQTLPPPLQSGYGFSRPSNKQKTEMTSGYTRIRRRFGVPLPIYGCQFWFTSEQFALFRGWWLHGLNDGEQPTNMPVLTPEDKNVVQMRTGRFVSDYTESQNDGYDSWTVKVNFELANESIISVDEYLGMIFDDDGNIRNFLEGFRNELYYFPPLTTSVATS